MIIVDQPQPPDYHWIPVALVRKIRVTTMSIGITWIGLGILIGTALVWVGNGLPVAEVNPITGLAIIAAVGGALCLVVSGIASLGARSSVSTGYLEANSARRMRRLLLGMWILGLLFAAFACGLLALLTRGPGDSTAGGYHGGFTATTAVFMVLSLLTVACMAISFFVCRRLLLPTAALLRKYGSLT